jgi:FlaA1/EpsC-like NDP-sugar epimerase
MFEGKTALVIGGAGSFGRWILKEILRNSVKEIHILSRDEEKQLDFKCEADDSRMKFLIGDVREYERIVQACRGVEIAYHAAAQKTIKSCEENSTEALKRARAAQSKVLNVGKPKGVYEATTHFRVVLSKRTGYTF